MKNIIRKISFIFLLIICCSFSIKANTELKRVVDKASLFSNDEIISLEDRIEDISDRYEMDIVIVTTDNVEGKSSMDYADDFFDYEGYGLDYDESGILMLINMEDREVYLSTAGKGINYFTDARIESILDDVYLYLSDGNYYFGAEVFLTRVENFLNSDIPSNKYTVNEYGYNSDYSNDVIKSSNYIFKLDDELIERVIISVLIALTVSSVICHLVILSYRKPKAIVEESYVDRNSINFIKRSDIFITSHTTRRKIDKHNNSSTRASRTHKSRSGRSHGGRGRGF